MKGNASVTEPEQEPQSLTREDYDRRKLALRGADFVVDGFATPAVYCVDGQPSKLEPAEFTALAQLLRAPGVAFTPRQLIPDANSDGAAQHYFQALRLRIEKSGARCLFLTVGRGLDLRYKFERPGGLMYRLIEVEKVNAKRPAAASDPRWIDCVHCGPYPRPSRYLWNDAEHQDRIVAAQQVWRTRHAGHGDK